MFDIKVWRASPEGKAWKEKNRAKLNEQHRRYRRSKKGHEVQAAIASRMSIKHREKFNCRARTRHAVKVGLLVKLPCEVCEEPKVHAHHPDYGKHLDVKWLCDTHHKEEHRKVVH